MFNPISIIDLLHTFLFVYSAIYLLTHLSSARKILLERHALVKLIIIFSVHLKLLLSDRLKMALRLLSGLGWLKFNRGRYKGCDRKTTSAQWYA